jgi:hypothetical protein
MATTSLSPGKTERSARRFEVPRKHSDASGSEGRRRNTRARGACELARARALGIDPGGVLLSHTVTRAVPSALEGLTTEFGMGSGVALPPLPPGNLRRAAGASWGRRGPRSLCCQRPSVGTIVRPILSSKLPKQIVCGFRERQANRRISTGQLRALRHIHTRPIDHVVYVVPSWDS